MSRARKEWKLGKAPLADVTELLEERGIKVMLLPLPESVSGLTCLVERPDQPPVPVIVVNKSFNLERRRFTLLHELGHRLMRVEEIDEEKAAHRFASSFLMPADHLREVVGQHRHGFGFAELVFIQAPLRRCRDGFAGAFPRSWHHQSGAACRVFSDDGTHLAQARTERADPELRTSRSRSVFAAYATAPLLKKLISVSKAADLLQEPVALIAKEMRGDDPPEDRCQ